MKIKTDKICMISCELTKIRMDFTLKDILIQYLEIYCKTFSIFSTIPSLWFLVPHLLETGAIVSFQLKVHFYDFVCCSLVHKVCLCCWLTNCLNFLTRSTYPISRLLYSFHYFSTSPFIFISSKMWIMLSILT